MLPLTRVWWFSSVPLGWKVWNPKDSWKRSGKGTSKFVKLICPPLENEAVRTSWNANMEMTGIMIISWMLRYGLSHCTTSLEMAGAISAAQTALLCHTIGFSVYSWDHRQCMKPASCSTTGLLGYNVSRGSASRTYLPVFGALFGYAHSIIQPNNATGFLQILHAALESRSGDVKPGEGM